jgi:hypothetical protein
MKLATPFVLVTLLCGPALADPAPDPTVQLKLAVSSNNDTRKYDLKLVDSTCSKITNSNRTLLDEVRACMHAEGAALRLEIDWTLKHDGRQIENKSTLVVKRGETFELAHAGAKLAVSVQ